MENNDTVTIKPTSGWKALNFRELWRYKDLLYFLTLRSIKAKYAQSVLGVGWAIIQPLVLTLVFTVIFGNLAKIGSDGIPYLLFSFTAMVPWNYFQNILTESTGSLISNREMISKVYFPRLVLPLSAIFSKMIDFGIGFLVLIGLLFYYQVVPDVEFIYIPFFLLLLIITSIGIGLILSAMAVQFRDINYAMSFMVRLIMYSAPVVYPLSLIPDHYKFVYALNPLVAVIEGFRASVIPTAVIPWTIIYPGILVSICLLIMGLFYFRKMEKHFADIA
ncbi:MAG: ABC transporter permease [Fulvivirga sp.]|uniref:ABC transporter permease n=1 Tax=Fulvivirga sp. TaxID=1931237 RepID=UPI0032F048D6